MRGSSAVLVMLGLSLFACSAEDSSTKQADAKWKCVPLAVQNGETVMCMATNADSSHPAPGTGGSTESTGVFVRTFGVPAGTSSGSVPAEEPAPEAEAPSSSAPTGAATSEPPEEFSCKAGTASCPPVDLPVPAPEGTGSAPSAPTSGGGEYACTEQGVVVDCTKKDLVCKEGTMPAPAGDKCVPVEAAPAAPAPAAPAPAPAPAAPAPAGAPASAPSAATVTSNSFEVGLVSETANANGSTTWTYRVKEQACAQDLSNWVLATGNCAITSASPSPYELVSPDPNALLYGVKWEVNDGFSDSTFSVTTTGATRGSIKFATKGPGVAYGMVDGPVCK